MSNVGFATLTVLPSMRGFAKAIGGQVDTDTDRAGREGGKRLGSGIIAGFGPAMGALAGIVSAGAVFGFFKGAIAEASDLGESVNALNVTYGENSEAIQALGRGAATAMGLSNTEFNGLAVRFSAFSKQIAGDGGDVVGTLQSITGRASDFASVMNLEVSEAAELFQSGLAGETEPLRKFGIDLSAAAVEAFAYANGIAESGAALTEAQKVQARYGSLMEQTAATQGDFQNTSTSLANANRILQASWDNVSAKIGTAFIPGLGSAVSFLASTVVPGIDSFITKVSGIGQALNSGEGLQDALREQGIIIPPEWMDAVQRFSSGFMDTLGAIQAAVGPYIPIIASAFGGLIGPLLQLLPALSPVSLIFKSLQPVLPQLASIVAQIAALFGQVLSRALSVVVPLVGLLVEALSGTFVALMPAVLRIVAALAGAILSLVPAIMPLVGSIFPILSAVLTQIAPIIGALATTLIPPLVSVFSALVAALLPVITQVVGALQPALSAVGPLFTAILGAVMPLIQVLLSILIPVIQALLPVVTTVFGVIASIITAAMGIVQGIIQVVTGLISGNWDQVWNGLGQVIGGVWNTIVAIVSGAINIIFSAIGAVLGLIGSLWNGFWNGLVGFFAGIWSNIGTTVTVGIARVIVFFQSLPGQIMSTLAGAGRWLIDTGRNLIEGLIGGIKDAATGIAKAVLKPVQDAIGGVKDFLGIKSPSRLLFGIGVNTGEGLVNGLWSMENKIARASGVLEPVLPRGVPFLEAAPIPADGGLAARLAAGSAAGGRTFNTTNNIELRDEDPRVVARKFGYEFDRSIAGAAL